MTRLHFALLACASIAACSNRPTEQPRQIECTDIREKMITEQKAKIAEASQERCLNDGKDFLTNPKSCFRKKYEKDQAKYIAEHPDPDQRRLDLLEGKQSARKAVPLPSAHEVACRIQIERELATDSP